MRLERTIDVGKNEVKDLGQLGFAKRRKDTNFVKAVDEFRLKFTAVNKRIDEFSLKLSKVVARIDRFANMVSAGVTSGNDNCIAKANFAVLNIAQDSLVEKLQERCKDFWMSFFNLVKQNDREWIFHDLRSETHLVGSTICDKALDASLVDEFIKVEAHDGTFAMKINFANRFGEFGFTNTGWAQE